MVLLQCFSLYARQNHKSINRELLIEIEFVDTMGMFVLTLVYYFECTDDRMDQPMEYLRQGFADA